MSCCSKDVSGDDLENLSLGKSYFLSKQCLARYLCKLVIKILSSNQTPILHRYWVLCFISHIHLIMDCNRKAYRRVGTGLLSAKSTF